MKWSHVSKDTLASVGVETITIDFNIEKFRPWFYLSENIILAFLRVPPKYGKMIKMQLFGKSSKSPAEAVKLLKESLILLERGGDGKKQEKALEEVR